ncbi:MAG TPA: PspC domain-containing protein [Solirubrobacteraceae bacterium]|jgi:phage shock protein PspC (stress-responsive transcriptional regulator)
MENGSQPKPVARATEKRWLGGVCQGIGEARGVSPGWLRIAVVTLTLVGGLGAILYLAAWLILPTRCGESGAPGTRGIVVLVKALAGLLGLVLLAGAGGAATVFGFGWIVFGVAAAAFIGALSVRRLGLGWALLPVAALTVPAAALAAGGVQLTPTDGSQTFSVPARALAAHGGRTYRSGLGTLLLDLRHTPLPRDRKLVLRIHAGVRRTIVALPSDECVNVVVNHDVNPFPVRVASLLTGHDDQAFADVFVFGRLESGWIQPRSGSRVAPEHHGATLTVDFASEGGSLYVRNYPDSVNVDVNPYWPGFPVSPESRPPTRGLSKALARREIRTWRDRRAREVAQRRRYLSLVGGPCASPVKARPHRSPSRRHAAHHATHKARTTTHKHKHTTR